MKALVVLLSCSTITVSYAQYSFGQFGGGSLGGFGGPSSFQPSYINSYGTGQSAFAGSSNPFDLFSSNTLNNNFFSQQASTLGHSVPFQTAPQNNFNTYSGYPFASNQLDGSSSGYFPSSYSSPADYNYNPPRSTSFGYPQVPQAPQQNSYQAAGAPVNQFNSQVQHYNPSTRAAPAYQPSPAPVSYQQPQQAYQTPPPPPQPSYQAPAPQYNPRPPVYQAPAPVNAPKSAPYINTAQLSYNAAAPAAPNTPPVSGGKATDKPTIIHPPAPVHYVSIGQKLEGDYKFGYETGKGTNGDESFRRETRDADGTVRGSYGYVDPSGKQITVHYEAGREGFKILSEDEVKSGAKKSPAPVQHHQPAPPVPQPLPVAPAPEPVPPPPPATEASSSDVTTQTAPQRRRKRKPGQA